MARTELDPGERGLGENDVWVCTSSADGTWSDPVNAGAGVNTGAGDLWPAFSPDGRQLFVTSGHEGDQGFNPYWVDAETLLGLITPTQTRSWGSVKALFR